MQNAWHRRCRTELRVLNSTALHNRFVAASVVAAAGAADVGIVVLCCINSACCTATRVGKCIFCSSRMRLAHHNTVCLHSHSSCNLFTISTSTGAAQDMLAILNYVDNNLLEPIQHCNVDCTEQVRIVLHTSYKYILCELLASCYLPEPCAGCADGAV